MWGTRICDSDGKPCACLLQPAELQWVSSVMQGLAARLGTGAMALSSLSVAFLASAALMLQAESKVGFSVLVSSRHTGTAWDADTACLRAKMPS